MAKVFSYKKFDLDLVNFSATKRTKTGQWSSKIVYPDEEQWFMQTPKCRIPFEVSDNGFCIEMDSGSFVDVVTGFEKKGLEFYKESTGDTPQIYSVVGLPKSSQYSPYLRLNLSYYHTPDYYDDKGKKLNTEEVGKKLCKGALVRLILKFKRITVNGGKFNLKMDVEQCRIYEQPQQVQKSQSYSFVDDSEED